MTEARRYRKKPVVIEAMQLDEDMGNADDVATWVGGKAEITRLPGPGRGMHPGVVIHTLEGNMRADPGDWIIRGVQGEFYPCKPDIFAATYEAVDDTVTERVSVDTEPTTDAPTGEAYLIPTTNDVRVAYVSRISELYPPAEVPRIADAFDAWAREQTAPTDWPAKPGPDPDGGVLTADETTALIRATKGDGVDDKGQAQLRRDLTLTVDLVGEDMRAVYGDHTANYMEESIRQHLPAWLRDGSDQ